MRNYDDEVRTFGEDHAAAVEYHTVVVNGSPWRADTLEAALRGCWAFGCRLGWASYELLRAGYSVSLAQLRGAFERFDAEQERLAVDSARDQARWARCSGRENRGLQR